MTERNFIKEIGDNLNSVLIECGVSQRELSEDTGISESTISRYICGERMPSIKNLVNICYALDCDINEIVFTYEQIY